MSPTGPRRRARTIRYPMGIVPSPPASRCRSAAGPPAHTRRFVHHHQCLPTRTRHTRSNHRAVQYDTLDLTTHRDGYSIVPSPLVRGIVPCCLAAPVRRPAHTIRASSRAHFPFRPGDRDEARHRRIIDRYNSPPSARPHFATCPCRHNERGRPASMRSTHNNQPTSILYE